MLKVKEATFNVAFGTGYVGENTSILLRLLKLPEAIMVLFINVLFSHIPLVRKKKRRRRKKQIADIISI